MTHLFAVKVTVFDISDSRTDFMRFIGLNAQVRFPIRDTGGVQLVHRKVDKLPALSPITARRNYYDALRDYEEGNDAQILNTEIAMRNAFIELETIEQNHKNAEILFAEGIISRDVLRQS